MTSLPRNAPLPESDRWLSDIHATLHDLRARSLGRQLRVVELQGPRVLVEGCPCLNLASNDYLGLSSHPHLKQAVAEAAMKHGTGSGASRLVTGHQAIHAEVERRFAGFKHAEAALLCPTGFQANLAAISALTDAGGLPGADVILLDKLCHASLIDAARASGATVRVFPHRDLNKLERLLQRATTGERRSHQAIDQADSTSDSTPSAPPRAPRRIILTDSVFSMDGDVADLPALCDLADRYDAILVVDEAHGSGVLGQSGAGLCELQGVAQRVDVVISTASKALGSLGGIVTAKREVIDWMVNRSRSFIYTTAVPPTQAAAILAALDVVRDEPQRRTRVMDLARILRTELTSRGWTLPETPVPTPILPLVVGTAEAALNLAEFLRGHGFYAPAIRPPTVAPGASRVRLTLRADLEDADLHRLLDVLGHWRP